MKEESGQNGYRLVLFSTLFYFGLGGVSFLFTKIFDLQVFAFSDFPGSYSVIDLVQIGVVGGVVLFLLTLSFENFFASSRSIRVSLSKNFGGRSYVELTYLGVLSGIVEEILFRGIIQPYLGLCGTALLFSALHVGPKGLFSTWTVSALLFGLVLGYQYRVTGSVWPSMISHCLVNVALFLRMRLVIKEKLNTSAM